jgi:ribosome-binding factor A
LNEKAGWLYSLLFKLLQIHTVPTLRFFHDPQIMHSIEMSQLIDRATRSDAEARVPEKPEDES